VSRIDGNKWAVGIRGFAGRFANKLLVLQDGRTLYNPLFSGVYWNLQEIMLEDIEQIEIIRGPAATLWGVNAVNGVINIKTKHARDTQGGFISASTGTLERSATTIRTGGRIGENSYLRGYGKYFQRDILLPGANSTFNTDWNDWRSGFRGDFDISSKNSVTIQGDLYNSTSVHENIYSGQNLLGRWTSTISDTSTFSLQLYYDRTSIKNSDFPELKERETRDTGDIELQHTFAVSDMHHIVWGTGFRLASDQMNKNTKLNPTYIPTSRTDLLFTAFLQDKITLLPGKLHLILGSRAEYNDTTNWENQPTARLLITPSEQHALWGAVSRALRTPSRAETTISSTIDIVPPPPEIRLLGNSKIPSEKLIAYEAGYRYQPLSTLSFDLALFYNDYSSLIGVIQGLQLLHLFL
jgi:iron complex outermembrane receptor protein